MAAPAGTENDDQTQKQVNGEEGPEQLTKFVRELGDGANLM